MSRSFRFMPPEPRPDSLTRPRLLRSLLGRWQHRVTSLTGGPGLGKTTLLAQAIAENRLAPRGEDVWVGLEPHDADADRLARVVSAAVNGNGAVGDDPSPADQSIPDPAAVADAVWRRSPTEACLVLDDVHLIPAGSTGAAWLVALVEALPANGHMVLASRMEPPVRLSRFGAQGSVLRLAEDDLRFSEDELTGFAAQRGLDPAHFGSTGGWPAMAELTASVERRFTGEYLWEEVLEPLGTVRRHVLAVVSDLGGADDHLASAAVGTPVELSRALDGVPLVARSLDGWYHPHGMWRMAPGIDLNPAERASIRRRAVDHLVGRERFDDAFSLAQEAELWDVAPGILRAACLSSDSLVSSDLGRWLSSSTDTVRTSSAGRLATGLHTAYTKPGEAIDPLEKAVADCRTDGDVDGELTAIAQLGQLAWWREDRTSVAKLMTRIFELEATGSARARSVACIARAVAADLMGDDATVLSELDRIDPTALDPAWELLAAFMQGLVHIGLGDPEPAMNIVERLLPSADPAMRYVLDALRLRAQWSLGRVDQTLAEMPPALAAARRTAPAYNLYLGHVLACFAYSMSGRVADARRSLEEAIASAPPPALGSMSPHTALAMASVQVAEGDEEGAAATLQASIDLYGIDRGEHRHSWRQIGPTAYVLVPSARTYWDEAPVKGYIRQARDLAQAVVALREGRGDGVLRTLEVPGPDVVRSQLTFRFAAELAVGLAAVGRSEGRVLLDALGQPGRTAVREMATAQPRQAKQARALLATVPAPPPRTTYLAVLGPLALHRDGPDGEEVLDPDMRRRKLQALLAFLVGHRRTTRSAIAAALWPDLDERSASNNLGVTLNHLLRLLEPWRDSGEPSYLVRLDGQSVHLVTGEHLRIDIDEFDEHLAAAARAEADGTPSVALGHDLAAVGLYRDDLHLDVPEADWFELDREHYRSRFVGAAVRAGQLLLGRGDPDQAQAVAHRALAVDQWAEGAYAVLVGAALARDDRSAATRILNRCLDALADLGAAPSAATQQLQRRVQGLD